MSSACVKVLEKDMKTLSKKQSFWKTENIYSLQLKDSHSIIPNLYTFFTPIVFLLSHLLIKGFYTQSTPTTITTIFKYKE